MFTHEDMYWEWSGSENLMIVAVFAVFKHELDARITFKASFYNQ